MEANSGSGGTIFRVKIRDLFWVGKKNPALNIENGAGERCKKTRFPPPKVERFSGHRWKDFRVKENRLTAQGIEVETL